MGPICLCVLLGSGVFRPLVAVAGGSGGDRTAAARALTRSAGWEERDIPAGGFVLKTWFKPTGGGSPVVRVYIEGDGFAWVQRNRPSMDPTPRDPLALRLALRDPAPSVVYLARPCQYVMGDAPGACREAHWTSERFSEEVVVAADQALSAIKTRVRAERIELVGYSGGGAVAVLVAARRNDVSSIRTVAGNLDPGEVNRVHKVSPLTGSLDPMDVAERVSRVPQVHFSGTDDRTVPPSIPERFAAAEGDVSCTAVRRIEGASHGEGWAERWPGLLEPPAACRE